MRWSHNCKGMPEDTFIVVDETTAEYGIVEYCVLDEDYSVDMEAIDRVIAYIDYCPFCGAKLVHKKVEDEEVPPPVVDSTIKLDCKWLEASMDGFGCRNVYHRPRCVLDEGGSMGECEYYAKKQ